jgi:hypothetical protein
MDLGMKFHATALDEMQVEYGEDTWIIKGLDTEMLSLWHNNYVKTSATERYITEGFHNQNVDRKKLSVILDYIEKYSWQKHLEHEIPKQRIVEEKVIIKEMEQVSAIEEQDHNKTRKWYTRLWDWRHKAADYR